MASMSSLYRAARARPLFRTSSTIGSFFIIVTSEFFGRAENRTYPTIRFNYAGNECFCFGVVDVLKVPSEKVVNPLRGRDCNMQCISDAVVWNCF